jgi:hypothetical protein
MDLLLNVRLHHIDFIDRHSPDGAGATHVPLPGAASVCTAKG